MNTLADVLYRKSFNYVALSLLPSHACIDFFSDLVWNTRLAIYVNEIILVHITWMIFKYT